MSDEVEALWRDAAQSWPALSVSRERFAAAVAAAGSDDLRAADLYLALACLDRDPRALAELEQLIAPIRAMLLRARYDGDIVDDAIQTVRYRLLVATPEREAKLATYRGRGSLAGWLRVVVLRQTRSMLGPRVEHSESQLLGDAASADAALGVLVRTHGPAIRAMFRAALAALDDRQRALLKLEIVDAVPHQRIAELHGVHRTTIVRWIEEARQLLARDVRRRVRAELALGDASADSLLRLLGGHVDLSLASGLLA